MREEVEIVPSDDGTFVARLLWRSLAIEKPLPPGFGDWPLDEQRAHLKRFVVPRLKALLARARKGIRLEPQDGERFVQPEQDRARMERAQKKREMRASKRQIH